MTVGTTALVRDYLADHPRRDEPSAPLFCSVTLKAAKQTGKRSVDADGNRVAPMAVDALAALSADEAAQRLVLDWSAPYRHQTFYKAVIRPAVAHAQPPWRALVVIVAGSAACAQVPRVAPHLRELVRCCRYPAATAFALHGPCEGDNLFGDIQHLFDDDHAETMAALEAMSRPVDAPNVVPMRRRN